MAARGMKMNREKLAVKIARLIGGRDYRWKMHTVSILAEAKLEELGDMTIAEFLASRKNERST